MTVSINGRPRLGRFAQWIEDRRWAANARRARRLRRSMGFAQRIAFDDALRPRLSEEPGTVIAYPDALYHIEIGDLMRAMFAAHKLT